MLARHNLVNIAAKEAQEKVDRTVGVSGIVAVSVAVQAISLLVSSANSSVSRDVYSHVLRCTTSGKGSLERSGKI